MIVVWVLLYLLYSRNEGNNWHAGDIFFGTFLEKKCPWSVAGIQSFLEVTHEQVINKYKEVINNLMNKP